MIKDQLLDIAMWAESDYVTLNTEAQEHILSSEELEIIFLLVSMPSYPRGSQRQTVNKREAENPVLRGTDHQGWDGTHHHLQIQAAVRVDREQRKASDSKCISLMLAPIVMAPCHHDVTTAEPRTHSFHFHNSQGARAILSSSVENWLSLRWFCRLSCPPTWLWLFLT